MIKNTWEILCRVSRNSRQSFKMLFRFLEKWKISLFDFKLLSIHWNDLSFSIDSNEIQSLHLCCQNRWIALFKYEINSIHLSGSCMKHSLKCFYSLDKTVADRSPRKTSWSSWILMGWGKIFITMILCLLLLQFMLEKYQ